MFFGELTWLCRIKVFNSCSWSVIRLWVAARVCCMLHTWLTAVLKLGRVYNSDKWRFGMKWISLQHIFTKSEKCVRFVLLVLTFLLHFPQITTSQSFSHTMFWIWIWPHCLWHHSDNCYSHFSLVRSGWCKLAAIICFLLEYSLHFSFAVLLTITLEDQHQTDT